MDLVGIDAATPRAAVAADGRSVLVWRDAPGPRLVASFGDARGRFSAPLTVSRQAHQYAVAPGAIAYVTADSIRVAVRDGRRLRSRWVASSIGSRNNGLAIAADPLGGWVVVEASSRRASGLSRIRVVSLDARGRPVGRFQELGVGVFDSAARQAQPLVVRPDGQAVLAFRRPAGRGHLTGPVMVAVRPHSGTFAPPVALPGNDKLADPRVTVADGVALVAATAVTHCNESVCGGQPRASRVAADGTPGPLAGPSLNNPGRAFGPWAVEGALVFQRKAGPDPFTLAASLRAVALRADGSVGALQTLTRERAVEPVALPLVARRTLVVWTSAEAFDAALAGRDGRFAATAAPTGPPPTASHFAETNRDAHAAGRYAIVAWSRSGVVRVSTRRF